MRNYLKKSPSSPGVDRRDFRNFDPSLMHDDIGMPFHPAAEAFYVSHKDSI